MAEINLYSECFNVFTSVHRCDQSCNLNPTVILTRHIKNHILPALSVKVIQVVELTLPDLCGSIISSLLTYDYIIKTLKGDHNHDIITFIFFNTLFCKVP